MQHHTSIKEREKLATGDRSVEDSIGATVQYCYCSGPRIEDTPKILDLFGAS